MKYAEPTKNEYARLKALIDYAVLDTPKESAYDDITLIASSICETPIALVSLVDSDRQWFKSHHGLDARETARDASFCGHAIQSTEVFEISDSSRDPRFADNPFAVGSPHVRFYAGAPLINADGFALGTLCVIDHHPRKLEPEQLRSLQALARQVVYLLELRKSVHERDQQMNDLKQASQLILNQQQQLLVAAKMSSLGIMSSGVAHEINNPLAILMGRLDKLIRNDGPVFDPAALRALQSAHESACRIRRIVKSLQVYSRDSKADPTSDFEVGSILENVLDVCGESLKSLGIRFSSTIPDGLSARCRGSELSQVLLNLLTNSIDAIIESKDKWISVDARQCGHSVEIAVMDSGNGISEELAQKIMIPFFTTKAIGKGTGLGLSISHGLLESQGGSLRLDPMASG